MLQNVTKIYNYCGYLLLSHCGGYLLIVQETNLNFFGGSWGDNIGYKLKLSSGNTAAYVSYKRLSLRKQACHMEVVLNDHLEKYDWFRNQTK